MTMALVMMMKMEMVVDCLPSWWWWWWVGDVGGDCARSSSFDGYTELVK